MIQPEEKFMLAAIAEAERSREAGEYAVGALVVREGKVISQSGVFLKRNVDSTAHAEVTAIREACKQLNRVNLEGCILYTTCEPCAMCTGAAIWARIQGIVFGATIVDMNEQRAKTNSRRAIDIPASEIATHGDPQVQIIGPFMREECKKLL